jgi:hypothetical protein
MSISNSSVDEAMILFKPVSQNRGPWVRLENKDPGLSLLILCLDYELVRFAEKLWLKVPFADLLQEKNTVSAKKYGLEEEQIRDLEACQHRPREAVRCRQPALSMWCTKWAG